MARRTRGCGEADEYTAAHARETPSLPLRRSSPRVTPTPIRALRLTLQVPSFHANVSPWTQQPMAARPADIDRLDLALISSSLVSLTPCTT
jgi:hypothetical protein